MKSIGRCVQYEKYGTLSNQPYGKYGNLSMYISGPDLQVKIILSLIICCIMNSLQFIQINSTLQSYKGIFIGMAFFCNLNIKFEGVC